MEEKKHYKQETRTNTNEKNLDTVTSDLFAPPTMSRSRIPKRTIPETIRDTYAAIKDVLYETLLPWKKENLQPIQTTSRRTISTLRYLE